jgi:hypothetical protein
MPGPQKYPASAITDWDNEIKKHIPAETITENVIDDFGEFVLTLQSEDDIHIDSITYTTPTLTTGSSQGYSGTVDVGLDLFSFHDNMETHEDRTERRLDSIEKRLCILEPKAEMIEKYEVLKDLYNQYRAAEALLYDADENDEDSRD